MSIGKFIGCVMMVVGSAIGAGILMLPTFTASSGFVLSAIIILLIWFLLTTTGLLYAKMSLALPKESCSFYSMSEKTLGFFGKTITWISCLLGLYLPLCGYMAAESSLVSSLIESVLSIKISGWLASGLFAVVLGTAVFWSTKAVDNLNRGLFSFKGFLLIATIALMLPQIDLSKLVTGQNIEQSKYLWAASPAFLCIFNYHFVIPSLRIYVGNKPKELKWIIILGTTISLIIYLLWVAATLGIIPLIGNNSFTTLARLGYDPGPSDLIRVVTAIAQNKWIAASINGFVNIAMTTSFLGVSLGLFDFIADGFKRPNTRFGRLQTAGLTFVPPFLFAVFCPHGFNLAMSYSACFVAIICILLPTLMAYRMRKKTELKSSCFIFIAIIIIGAILFVLPILRNLHLLPILK